MNVRQLAVRWSTRSTCVTSSAKRTALKYLISTHIVFSLIPSRALASPVLGTSEFSTAVPQTTSCAADPSDPLYTQPCGNKIVTMAGQRVSAFAWQLQQQLAQKAPEATSAGSFVSPISLYIALGLALSGAGPASSTEQELYHALHQDKARFLGLLSPKPATAADVEQLTKDLSALSTSLEQSGSSDGAAELIVANGVWLNKDSKIPLRPEYAAAMLQLFKAEVQAVGSVDAINAWADRVTKGLIKVAVPPGTQFDLVLTNAVYFKGLWEHAFKKEATQQQPFHLDGGPGDVQVDMMSKHFKASEGGPSARKVQYLQSSSYQAVRLPYKGSTITAVIVLPSADLAAQGIAAAAAQLDIHELLNASKYHNVGAAGLDVALPKFTVKSGPSSLKKELQAMGIVTPFTDQVADFSRMSKDPLYISDILQSVCVIVDEEGTEAAAVTAVIMMRATAVMAQPPVIRFDRPFLFMLVDDATGTPLFVGTVTNPSASPA